MRVVGAVLTFNEEIHLERCLESMRTVCTEFVVIDCFSTDRTLEIARRFGARILQHEWTNHATQFNWGLSQLDPGIDWVLRLDADEYLSPELAQEIVQALPKINPSIMGVYLRRRMAFQGRLIRHGGVFPVRIMRLFRRGAGQCENRWMDEHIIVAGPTLEFRNEFIDDNHNSLTWWTTKHNRYSSLEAVDILNAQWGFMAHQSSARLMGGGRPGLKRWMKEQLYWRLPGGVRALAYFLFRYIIQLGFLDGREGFSFHFLQGFWYRYLVDAKLSEVQRTMRLQRLDVREAISRVLEVKLP